MECVKNLLPTVVPLAHPDADALLSCTQHQFCVDSGYGTTFLGVLSLMPS